jgi:uncharacterized protein (DUF3084 family)
MAKSLFELDEILESLKHQRDEIKLQLQLAKAEARDEWETTEHKFEQLRNKAEAVRDEIGEASEDVLAALKITAEEIKHGYDRVRKKL